MTITWHVTLLAGGLLSCGPVVYGAVGADDAMANSIHDARIRGTFDEAKLSLSALASAEQAHLRATHGWVLFPLTPDRVPVEPISVPPRPEWGQLEWAPPNPTRFCFRADAAPVAGAPEALLHVEGMERGVPVRFDMHVTDAQIWW